MSCQQVPTTPAFNPYPRSVQVGEFEVAIGGGIWVAIRAQSDGGSAIVGHHDRNGTNPDPVANASWNSSHGTRGCSVDQLKMSGSAGLMYCFASN